MATAKSKQRVSELFTVEEVATLFRVSKRTLADMLRDGKIASIKIGRRRLISEHEINRVQSQGV